MTEDGPAPLERTLADRIARRRTAAQAGHDGDPALARRFLDDPDGSVRATAVGALARLRALTADDAALAARDPDPAVRRRLADELGRTRPADPQMVAIALALLDDDDHSVVEAAAWAAGECLAAGEDGIATGTPAAGTAVVTLSSLAVAHADPLVREAAIAALGSIGEPGGLPAIRAGLRDKPAIRRRAVLALAAFEGAEVEEALRAALDDRDWQVRQIAEDLLGEPT